MRDESVLNDDERVGAIRADLSNMIRAANAAGFNTADATVQAALVNAWAATSIMQLANDIIMSLDTVASELRQSRRAAGDSYYR